MISSNRRRFARFLHNYFNISSYVNRGSGGCHPGASTAGDDVFAADSATEGVLRSTFSNQLLDKICETVMRDIESGSSVLFTSCCISGLNWSLFELGNVHRFCKDVRIDKITDIQLLIFDLSFRVKMTPSNAGLENLWYWVQIPASTSKNNQKKTYSIISSSTKPVIPPGRNISTRVGWEL